MNRFATATLMLVAVLVTIGATAAEPESIDLFNGKDLAGWHVDIPALDDNPDGDSA